MARIRRINDEKDQKLLVFIFKIIFFFFKINLKNLQNKLHFLWQ